MRTRYKYLATLALCVLLSPLSFPTHVKATILAALCENGTLVGVSLSPTAWCLARWTPGGAATGTFTRLVTVAVHVELGGSPAEGSRLGTTLFNPSGQLGPVPVRCSKASGTVDMTGTMTLIPFAIGRGATAVANDHTIGPIGVNSPILGCVPIL